MQLSTRQQQIIKIVREQGPIKGEDIAESLGVVRATLRPDLTFLTKSGYLDARPRVGYYYTGKSISSRVAEEIKRIRVKDMKAVPAVVSCKATVYEAIVNLFVLDVGSLFIVSEGGILEGVVSRKDLLKIAMGQADVKEIPITVIMTRMPNIVTVLPNESLWSAAQKMVSHEVDALPVVRPVDDNEKNGLEVIGRITKTTITKAFVELGLNNILSEGGEIS